MDKVTAYFSHAIRGLAGKNASSEVVKRNCAKAKEVADWVRKNVPEIDLYVPAEHEDFVHIAYSDKYLTEEQILAIDCKILEQRDFHMVYVENNWVGGGLGVEINHAKKCGKVSFFIQSLDEVTAAALRVIVKDLLKGKESDRTS